MEASKHFNYLRITEAIELINSNPSSTYSLEELAKEMGLSPFHFQRVFTEWAGTSPKKFIHYLRLQHAKSLLRKSENTLFDVAYETGLSSTSRLHDLFIQMEGMTPNEYKNGGVNLSINYHTQAVHFGDIFLASTSKGICVLSFESEEEALLQLKNKYPKAQFIKKTDDNQAKVIQFFNSDWNDLQTVKLHLRGTEFQLKVWESLLKIPSGRLSTYGEIAAEIGNPKASRAVGTAIGSNPISYLIPCHRVIQASGIIGGYRWGPTRKKAMIAWESALTENKDDNETI